MFLKVLKNKLLKQYYIEDEIKIFSTILTAPIKNNNKVYGVIILIIQLLIK